jgi:trans-2-enoyl-CoA reductase
MSYLALTLKNFGEPATALELMELPSEEPKNSEAIVSMDAVGMHIADGLFVRGREMITRTMPCVPGFEGVGTVSKIGTGVKSLKEGDKVLLPMGTGSMRQELKIHASQLTKVPKPYAPDEQLALITVNGFTAYFLLKDYRKLKQNDWIIQNAANSNVGRYLIALAKQEGIKTINIVRRKEVARELKKIGGTEVIISSDEFPSKYLSKFLKRKIMLGIDAVAGDATENLAICLADGSLLVNYGTVTKIFHSQGCQHSMALKQEVIKD